VIDNEICSLAHGTYNLGFLAIRNDTNGRRLAEWWNERLLEYCFDDKTNGIFVDQKWCDLVPAMFDGVMIVRDPRLQRRQLELEQPQGRDRERRRRARQRQPAALLPFHQAWADQATR